MSAITADEFASGYAARSGTTVQVLAEHGRAVRPCDCAEPDCPGWQMAHIAELQWAVDHGIATPAERALLDWRPVEEPR